MDEGVKAAIRTEILVSATGDRVPNDDEDLFDSGFLDSMSLMRLLIFINKKLGVSFRMGELRLENFRSINSIVAQVERRKGSFKAGK